MVRMLVLRPDPDGALSAERLSALGISAELFPLFARRNLSPSLPDARGFAGLAITSANALRALSEQGLAARYADLPTFTVGDKTAAEARRLGFAHVESADGAFADLVALIARRVPGGPVLYPAGTQLSGDLAHALAPHGIMVVTARVYDMVPAGALPDALLDEIESGALSAALLYSRRAAEAFVSLLAGKVTEPARRRFGMLCLSEAVAAPVIAARFARIGLADHPSEEAMMALALSFARAQNTP